jgi:heme A synthase
LNAPVRSRYAAFAWGVLGFTLLVILWGAFVRATGSGAGCGNHWPLCNGEVVPRAPALQTMIEFGHRLTSGLALVLVAALVAGAWRTFPPGHPVRRGAAASGLFLVSEALIGAGLVLLEHVASDASLARAYWVGGHLVNTFLLVAALTLTAWWASGGAAVRWRGHGGVAAVLATALAGVLLLGVSGAITALGDTLFPVATLAVGKALTFSDGAHVFVRLRIWHPVMAVVVGAWIAATAVLAARERPPAAQRLAVALVGLYAAQLALGLLNVALLAPVALQVAHLLLSDLIWIALVLLAASALAEPAVDMGVSPAGARRAAGQQALPRHPFGASSGGPAGETPASR